MSARSDQALLRYAPADAARSGHTLHLVLRKGRDLRLGKAPDSSRVERRAVGSVGLMAADFPGVALDLKVAEGDRVGLGQVLCTDRHCAEIAFVASAAGRVSEIRRGKRRRIDAVVIAADGDAAISFDTQAAAQDDQALRAVLMASGAWVAFRTRPFGLIPGPGTRPAAIFVTATASNPQAADSLAVLSPQIGAFQCGLDAMLRLTGGSVFLCQPPGPALATATDRLIVAQVSGPHPSGLAGTHIHRLFPVTGQRVVWQIGYQDVAAIGHLLTTGQVQALRTISVAGDGVPRPQLVSAPLGAGLADLTRGLLADAEVGLLTGSALTGRALPYLGRHDLQVTTCATSSGRARSGSIVGRLLALLPVYRDGTMQPCEAFDSGFPFDLPPAPLMRALAVGDIETAERLGCLELLEEDMALLSWLCASGNDYGALLRHALDELAAGATP